jgi:surfactin synthase thioesterase subunit
MKFYSGFSLSNDRQLFKEYLKESEFTIAGFSYGAIRAFEEALASSTRIDTLQLFSPAFFQDRTEKFIRMQKIYYSKDADAYLENFFRSCFLPAEIDESVSLEEGSGAELDTLLTYEWKCEKLQALKDRGVEIEIYLGNEDKIISAGKAKEFFLPYATTYMINHAGHTLQTKENNE